MVMFSSETFPSKAVLPAAASLVASAVLVRTMANELVPSGVQNYLNSCVRKLINHISARLTVVIEESEGLVANQMFDAANVYLGTKLSRSTRRIKVLKPEKDDDLSVTVDRNQEIDDDFDGVRFTWVLQSTFVKQVSGRGDRSATSKSEIRFFELTFHRKHKEMALRNYLPYILRKAKAIREEGKSVRLYTVDYNGTDYWSSVLLNHPATFETIAMDEEKKKELIEDLNMFVSRKDYYRRVGKAWKRGYLFYGPPGTGKSSLVAAMANHLRFDVYDLDLREVQCNSDLKRLLIGSANRSILVIEDIDCNVGVQSRELLENGASVSEDDKITLSGLLNFIDGLWSSCGHERIIVFTTNHKDRLDKALLRPGRMDVHIEMSYCKSGGFKTLARNYLGMEHHPSFDEVEELLGRARATPAEVAGELMRSDSAEVSIQCLLKLLRSRCMANSASWFS